MQIKVVVGSVLALAALAAAAAISQDVTRLASDGVFTTEQAKRGEATFGTTCAVCHGDDLGGGELGPSLSGNEFETTWKDHKAGEIVDRIQKTMPSGNPGKITRAQATDLTAYILSFNKYPAGATEMPSETDSLQQIVIDAVKAGK